MITEYQIANFKAFGSPQTLPIRPITLIFGPNSSGKSSIFQSFLLLKQSLEEAEGTNTKLLFKGKLIDLGNYREIIYQHDLDKEIQIKFKIRKPEVFWEVLDPVPSEYSVDHLNKIDNELIDYKFIGLSIFFSYNIKLMNVQVKKLNNYFNSNNFPSATYIRNNEDGELYLIENNSINKVKKDNKLRKNQINNNLRLNFKNILPDFNYLQYTPFEDDDIENMYHADVLISMTMASIIKDFLADIHYLGPQRESPERYYSFSGNQTRYVGKSGKFVSDLLITDNELKGRVNEWFQHLEIGYELKISSLTDPDTEIRDLFALRLCDKNGVHVGLTDVGFGLSQVLPVIVQSVVSQGKTILIEQPEYHLHPRLQAELGDMFIESALGEQKNTFLIETHSEHLILRILRRIRETSEGTLPEGATPITPDQVSVVYVQPGPEGSQIIPLPVTEDGDFSEPWPDGFFTERAEELF
jgi:predicted ATPase